MVALSLRLTLESGALIVGTGAPDQGIGSGSSSSLLDDDLDAPSVSVSDMSKSSERGDVRMVLPEEFFLAAA